jgi:hypothetical protein
MCMRLSVLEAMLCSKSSLRRRSGHFVRCVSHLVVCGCRTCGAGHDHDACGVVVQWSLRGGASESRDL